MNPSKRTMYAVLAGVGISLGAVGIASAASTPATNTTPVATAATTVDTTPPDSSTTATTPATAPTETNRVHTPSYTSSVTIPVAADGSEPTDAELQAVATVSSDEATAAALASTPGTAGTAELKSVAGNVVWEVDVTATAGGSYDVIVDAGSSTVLDTHIEGGGGGHKGHHADDEAASAAASTATTG